MLILLALGCTGPAAPDPVAAPLASSWITTVVREPGRFTAVVDAGGAREGWIALHRNDLAAAQAAGGVPAARAAEELSRFHEVLARASDQAWLGVGARWESLGGPPPDSALPLLVWAAAVEARDEGSAARWRGVAEARPGAVGALASRWTSPLSPPEGADPLLERARLHAGARDAGAEPSSLREAGERPLLVERPPAGGAERTLWDPWLHHTLTALWASRATAAPGADPLAGSLFSASLTGSEPLPAQLTALGLTVPGGADEPERCRELVRGLDAILDPWAGQLAAEAGEDGKALLNDLRLVPVTRARVLVQLGVDALAERRPACALAYAELARDHQDGRALTPVNSPTLFAVLATANLQTGHTREALDALQVLVGPWPEVTGLDELVGDLAVLEGIHRSGDSREN